MLSDWKVCTLGTHLGDDLNHLIVDYTDIRNIYHTYYQNGTHADPVYYLALDNHRRILVYSYSQLTKTHEVVPVKDLCTCLHRY